MRAFVSAKAYGPRADQQFFGMESGRRSDGQSSWATMATKTYQGVSVLGGYTGFVKVCVDKSLGFDPCSGERSGSL